MELLPLPLEDSSREQPHGAWLLLGLIILSKFKLLAAIFIIYMILYYMAELFRFRRVATNTTALVLLSC